MNCHVVTRFVTPFYDNWICWLTTSCRGGGGVVEGVKVGLHCRGVKLILKIQIYPGDPSSLSYTSNMSLQNTAKVMSTLFGLCWSIRGAGLVQWWEHSPPTNVGRVRVPNSASVWVKFVVGSRPCSERVFTGYSGFPLSSKTNISKFQFDLDRVDEEPPCGCATAIPIYLFILKRLNNQ